MSFLLTVLASDYFSTPLGDLCRQYVTGRHGTLQISIREEMSDYRYCVERSKVFQGLNSFTMPFLSRVIARGKAQKLLLEPGRKLKG